jgi:hypothetical protein
LPSPSHRRLPHTKRCLLQQLHPLSPLHPLLTPPPPLPFLQPRPR